MAGKPDTAKGTQNGTATQIKGADKMTAMILAEITASEWTIGVLGTIVAALVVASLLAVAAHIANSDKHVSKSEIVFTNVCDAKEKTVGVEIANLKDGVIKLESTVAAGFTALTTQIQNLKM
jgi:hypothetical protein